MEHRDDDVIAGNEIGSASQSGDTCPVTGLPIVRRPEWTDVELDVNHTTTIHVIGGCIIHTRPRGYATRSGILKVVELIDSVIDEAIDPGTPNVQVSDYSDLQGASFGARRTFASRVQLRPGILAFIAYGASPLFTLAIKLSQKLRFIPVGVEIVPDYETAVRSAVGTLGEAGVRGFPPPGTPTETEIDSQPGSLSLDLENFQLRHEIIDGHIIHGTVSGFTGMREAEQTIEVENLMISSLDPSFGETILVANFTDLQGISSAARRYYVTTLKNRQRTNPISLFICYGVNPMIRQLVNISRNFVPFRVRVARDRSAALEIARNDTGGGALTRIKSALFTGKRAPSPARPAELDQLLRLIANIDWARDGPVAADPTIANGHSLAPVVEALELIKSEIDDLFRVRRRAEEALRESEERYREILETIADGYYEIDLKGRLQFFNDALLRIFNYQHSDTDSLDAISLVDPDNRTVAIGHFRDVIETGRPAHITDFEMRTKDGKPVHVEASISLIRNQDGKPAGFRGIIRDITERFRTAEDKANLEAQLRRSQRMEAIGTLAGGIAHNFNNLLMGIQGNVSLMAQDMAADNPLTKRLKTIEGLVDGGSKLTSQLLGYARSGRVDVRVIDLNKLVVDTAETFSLTRKEFRVHTDLTGKTLPVEVDPAQIEQAFLNLLINAADAMPRGGDIFLASELVPHSTITDPQNELEESNYALIAVRDTGCGMEPTTIDRAFEPFFTTKGLTGGTGLGLASAYGIVRAHGGRIDIDSTVGEGSTMTILLPAVAGSVAAGADTKVSIVKGEGTILVVDDNPEVLEACISMLELLHYTPICAGSGGAAVDIFTRRKDEIDLVILDLILTDLGGGEVFDRIREQDPGARVLLASGYSLDGEAAGILDRGCDDFIQKPFTLEQLSIKLDRLIRNAD